MDHSKRTALIGAVVVCAMALLLLSVTRHSTQQLVESNAPVNQLAATPTSVEPDHMWVTRGEIPYRTPITRANMSTFVAKVSVDEIVTATFNTEDGSTPEYNAATYVHPASPFASVPVTATLTPTETLDLQDAWVADGNLVSPFAINRLAIVDVDTVYKGDASTDAIVLILPGGVVTDSTTGDVNSGKTYQEITHHPDMEEGQTLILFSNTLWPWQVEHADAYPFVDRCIERAADLVSQESLNARCELIGAVYLVDGTTASSSDTMGTVYSLSAIETEVAAAVATEATTSTFPYYATPRHVGGDWPVPTP